MRLTGGLDRGRHLIAPRGARTRPTASKVRQALFNILGPPAGPVLDLYAGTGALGMEALSRGAPQAVFVERDGSALSALRRNLREMRMDDRAEVIGTDVKAALRRLVSEGASTGSETDAEAATDRALERVLGTTRDELTEAWLTRLGRLASKPG